MVTLYAALWIIAVVFFALAWILPFLGTPEKPVSAGKLNLIALGLFFAALTHLVGVTTGQSCR